MRDISKHPAVVLLTLAISVVALVLAIASFSHTNSVDAEQRQVDVDVKASLDPAVYNSQRGVGVSVSYANTSLRPVIVREVSLRYGRHEMGVVRAYSSEGPAIPGDPASAPISPLPLTMQAREGRTITMFVDDNGLAPRCLIRAVRKRDFQHQETCRLWRAALDDIKSRLHLHVELDPGGWRDYAVGHSDPDALSGAGWGVIWRLGLRSVELGLQNDGIPPTTGVLFRLDVWRAGDAHFHRSFDRPLVGKQVTTIPLRQLEPARYLYAFRVDQKVVRTGCFSTIPGSKPFACR
jgi:hypothetical protein